MAKYGYILLFLFSAGLPAALPASSGQFVFLTNLYDWFPLPMISGVVFTLLVSLSLLFLSSRWRFLLAIICAVLLCIFTYLRLIEVIYQQIPVMFEGTDITVEGRVTGLPTHRDGNSQFVFIVDTTRIDDEILVELGSSRFFGNRDVLSGQRIRLSWRTDVVIRPAQKWRFTVRLKRPRGMVNPRGFDYQAWLLRQGIMATGYVKAAKEDAFLGEYDGDYLSAWRFRFVNLFSRYVDDVQYVGIFKALLAGDKSDITNAQWWIFNDTGTVHLMAISGLHVGLVTSLVYFLSRLLIRPLCFIIPFLFYRHLPSIFSILAALCYSALAGFSLPTQRVLIVVVLLGFCNVCGIRCRLSWLLALAALMTTVLDPFSFTQPGFWLSFLAVVTLIYVFGYRSGGLSKKFSLLLTQLVLFFGLLPVMGMLGSPLSFSSPLANLLAVPVVSVVILPSLCVWLFVSLIPWLGDDMSTMLLMWIDSAFHWLMLCLEYIQRISLLWTVPQVSGWLIALSIVCVLCFLSTRLLRLQLISCVVLLVTVIGYSHRKTSHLALTVLDVGQGLSTVLRYTSSEKKDKDNVIVYDLGARYSERFNMGERVVYPYLSSLNIGRVDTLIVSHSDNDHAGGYSGFIHRMSVSQVMAGESEKLMASDSLLDTVSCNNMSTFMAPSLERLASREPNGVSLQILWPRNENESHDAWLLKANNRSCVLLVTYRGKKILFMGDTEAKVEHYLLRHDLLPKNIDVLIAGHHGSKTSSSIGFVHRVKPKVVIFSSGFNNRYHHPHPSVTDRYRRIGSRLINTADSGAVQIEFNDKGLFNVRLERLEYARLWFFGQ